MMQYDDDIEESKVSIEKQAGDDKKPEPTRQPAQASKPNEERKETESDEEDDDFLMDDPMAFVERQDSQQADVKNLFEDDPKVAAR